MSQFKDNVRKIQIYPTINKLHTAWRSMISDSPEGYIFIGIHDENKQKFLDKLIKNKLIKNLYHFYLKIFKSTAILNTINKVETLKEANLVLSMGILYNGNKLWIMDILDIPYCMAGNSKELFLRNIEEIEKNLSQENCKAIVCEHGSSIEIMKEYFSKEIIDKIVLIYPAVKPIPFKENKNKFRKDRKEPIKILFMGSINNPEDFYMKGGFEVIKTFEFLQKKHTDIQLIIRCKISDDLRGELEKNNQIILMEKEIPFDDLIKLYVNSDILFLPSHTYVLMAVLEAMYFKLPIVAIDTYAVKDHIMNGKTGFVVEKSNKLQAYNDLTYPNNLRTKNFFEEVKNVNEDLVKRLAGKIELLIKSPTLREKMGDNGHKLATTKFSIQHRNKKWKKLFDEILSNHSPHVKNSSRLNS